MNSLYLAWQAPENSSQNRAWYPIGRLDAEKETVDELIDADRTGLAPSMLSFFKVPVGKVYTCIKFE